MRHKPLYDTDLTGLGSEKLIKRITLRDGTIITLRPEVESDLEPLWKMFSSLGEESLRYLPIPFTRERVEGWIENIDYDRALPILGIATCEGCERVVASATLSFSDVSTYNHKAEFGITVHDDYQGKGLGTQLTRHMIDIARWKGLRKITLTVLVENHRAICVYQKCGFKVEGRLEMEHYNYITGEYGDAYVMGIIL